MYKLIGSGLSIVGLLKKKSVHAIIGLVIGLGAIFFNSLIIFGVLGVIGLGMEIFEHRLEEKYEWSHFQTMISSALVTASLASYITSWLA